MLAYYLRIFGLERDEVTGDCIKTV
jgi:hypothetical protein